MQDWTLLTKVTECSVCKCTVKYVVFFLATMGNRERQLEVYDWSCFQNVFSIYLKKTKKKRRSFPHIHEYGQIQTAQKLCGRWYQEIADVGYLVH